MRLIHGAIVAAGVLGVAALALHVPATRTARAESEGEEMIGKAVTYLTDHQNADGSWGAPGKPGEIGIAALVLKALHESPVRPKDASHEEKGLAWLLKQQQPD